MFVTLHHKVLRDSVISADVSGKRNATYEVWITIDRDLSCEINNKQLLLTGSQLPLLLADPVILRLLVKLQLGKLTSRMR